MTTNNENVANVNKYRQQLMFLSNQKQQLQFQLNVLDGTLKELEKTTEKKVYKGVGNIFILKDKEEVVKETKDLKETLDLRMKTLQKQEEETLKKINSFTKAPEKEANDSQDGVV